MKRFWVILFVLPLFAQDINKHNISLGMLDDKTGFSLIGYTYNIEQTEMDEFFIGGGTMLMAFSGSAGWKHYFKKSKLSYYSVLSGQGVMHLGFSGFMPTASFALEYNLTKKTQIKIGLWGMTLLGGTSGEDGGDTAILPFIGLNFGF
ncbi:MAG: hypothetical protein VX680_07225 [Candidatus Neomarinimicrobiota bacterium]|nr:hypothetical protein [Candidatus Neomarinimicrobiota bacterium]